MAGNREVKCVGFVVGLDRQGHGVTRRSRDETERQPSHASILQLVGQVESPHPMRVSGCCRLFCVPCWIGLALASIAVRIRLRARDRSGRTAAGQLSVNPGHRDLIASRTGAR